MRLLPLLALALALAPAALAQDAAAPTTPSAAPAVAEAPLYRATGSMFADPVARRAGDVLTVVLAERTSAARRSQYDARSMSGVGGAAGGDSTLGRFNVDARFAADASAQNETALNDLLSGTVSVLVTGVDAAGNLQVEGERRISVNGVGHRLKVRGLVRPTDISANNTVLSFQIANADVVYRRDGRTSRFGPAFLGTVGLLGLIVAGIFVGS
jgi:flagellar L-ring protein precursor FlgH